MENTSENPASSSTADHYKASQSLPHPGTQSSGASADQWPEWLTRRLQFSIPAWAIAVGALVLLLFALD